MKNLKLFLHILIIGTTSGLQAQQQISMDTYSGQSEVKASQEIVFSPGFHVPPGSSFRAYISSTANGCLPLVLSPTLSNTYTLTRTVLTPGFTSSSQLNSASTCQISTGIEYYDGLGRVTQSVSLQSNPSGKDIVQPYNYDVFGRMPKGYEAYTVSGNNGGLRPQPLTELAAYYNSAPSGVKATASPFSETKFDSSPLSRALEQGAPGDTWQPANNHTLRNSFLVNDNTAFDPNSSAGSRRVAQYYASTNSNGTRTLNRASGTDTYDNGLLYVTISKDENWQSGCYGTVEQYTDRTGRLILKRTYNQASNGQTEMLSTYYVYDEYNNLCFVLPPKAEPDQDNAINQSILDNLCYQYRFDERNRLTEKKTPGRGWEYLVYNSLGQLVMSQDAIQRNKSPQEWAFAKYDALGRTVMTGIYQHPGSSADGSMSSPDNSTRAWLQGQINAQSYAYEYRDNGGAQGYSARTIPGSNIASYLTVNYYDDYAIPGLPSAYSQQASFSSQVAGLPTASKTAVLNNTAHQLWSVNFYDDKGYAVKSIVQHYLAGSVNDGNYDEITSSFSFSGQLLSSVRTHKAGGNAVASIHTANEYDAQGRILNVRKKVNNGAEILLAQHEYNDIGQLRAKKLHSENDGASFLQTNTYTYNERGWLTYMIAPLFTEQLRYNDPPHGSTPRYNGDLAEQEYITGAVGGQWISYAYDKLGRLTQGNSTEGFYENSISYDKAGNILGLNRDGSAISYNYTSGTNQLSSVSGAGLNTASYQYDINGNTTYDGSKSNISLGYNALDLPQSVSGNQSITYTYDATGAMLRKQSAATGTSEYIGGIQYNNAGVIDFIQTEEGRYRYSDGKYLYDLKDHLGNTRISFDRDPYNGTARRIQEDEYYPFGKRRAISPVSPINNYLYNGKELQPELSEYDYGARFYNAEIGRWNTVDPVADHFGDQSPYNYVNNSPANFIDPTGMYGESWKWPLPWAIVQQLRSAIAGNDPGPVYRSGREWGFNTAENWNGETVIVGHFHTKKSSKEQLEDFPLTLMVNKPLNQRGTPWFNEGEWLRNASGRADANYFFEELVIGGKVFQGGYMGLKYLGEGLAATKGMTGFRYMSTAELNAIKETGYLRGGLSGETYFTKDLYKSAAKAQSRLSLGSTPALRVEFEMLNNPTLLRSGTKVLPANGMIGRGAEFMTTDPVKVRLINWQPLR